MRSRLVLSALLLSALPRLALADPPPRVDGRALWDGPAATMPPALRASSEQARRLLASRLPPLGAGPDSMAAFRERLQPWLQERVTLARELLGAPAAGGREELVRLVLGASLLEHVSGELSAMPLPRSLRGVEGAEPLFREQLERMLVEVRRTAQSGWQRCARLDRAALPAALSAWPDACAARAAAQGEALARRPAEPLAPPPPPLDPRLETPAECAGGGPLRDPDAPAPDESAPRSIVVLLEDDDVATADRPRVLDAIAARIGRVQRGARLVPTAELLRAERLVAERRWDEAGPACGQAPPLPAVLARRFPNLVLAHATTWGADGTCSATVWFERAGTDDRGGLPRGISTDVRGDCGGTATWLAAARRLRVGGTRLSGIFGSLRGGADARAEVGGAEDDDPWLRVAPVVREAESRFTACLPARGTASFALGWTIGPTGVVLRPRARTLSAAPAVADAVRACVERALGTLAFPCTRSGREEPVEARVCLVRDAPSAPRAGP